MSRRVPLLLAILAGVLLVAGRPATAAACSCVNATETEQVARADFVFVGAAVDVRASAGANPVQFLFAVEEVRKGPTLASAVVMTAANGGACGAGFTVDTRWLVFATRSGDAWASTLCSGNQPLGAAAAPSDAAEWPDQAEQAAQGDANPALPLQSFVMIVVVVLLAVGSAVAFLWRGRAPRRPAGS
jgi:hypothetical protein